MPKLSRRAGKPLDLATLSPEESHVNTPQSFPIVAIGASAGGLEALETFLSHVPGGCGMAFVIIQHLDPTHQGIMPELLQRTTAMPVVQVQDSMPLAPDHVYVIPPNKDMSILHGVLHLFVPSAPRGLRLPIDFFFRSLADDRHEHSVGIILSGMGTDGTLGIKAIKEADGLILVQDPLSAKFDGMPRSAIATGLADFIAPAEELCAKLIAYREHAPLLKPEPPAMEDKTESALDKAIILLRAHTRHDFSLYKKSTLYRRIERRMGIHQIDTIAHYVRYLQENLQERELLFKELLIGVTSFFRDSAAWDCLRDNVLPELFAGKPHTGGVIRAWTPGCSTGEEAYSLAILFKEAREKYAPDKRFTFQIFATDLDSDAIEKARQGAYPANIAADVLPERLHHYFVQAEDGSFKVTREIREMVTLAVQDVLIDPPFTKLDILICRNLLIYLSPDAQKKIIPLFHYSLNPSGALFLGSAETIGAFTDLFAPHESAFRIYKRNPSPVKVEPMAFPLPFFPIAYAGAHTTKQEKPVMELQTLADQLLLQQFSPAAVLVNKSGDIVYISGRTGKYLEPAAGKVNFNIFAMAREGLRIELTGALQKAATTRDPVVIAGIDVKTNSHYQKIALTVQAIHEPEPLQGMFFIIFTDLPESPEPAPKSRSRKKAVPNEQQEELERAIHRLQEELHTTREEMQTSQEELRSANEEMQSTNEELQSSNEELTTSKEEMQSLNEELQTVNAELQARLDELQRTSNDMKNLLDSTEIATIFLDSVLNLRRFTPRATQIFKLISSDIGRPITDIVSNFSYPELIGDVQEVLRTLVFIEKQIPARDGRWFAMRIMPYRTMDNVIDGVVITYTDISALKKLEEDLNRLKDAAKGPATP